MKHSNLSVFIPHLGCPNDCSFCNQHTITGRQKAPTAREVEEQLSAAMQTLKNPMEQTEIAFFGGSFTAVEERYQHDLLDIAARFVRQYGLKGIRISTRPDKVDLKTLETLKAYGVTAIELGAQSLNDTVLQLNHRGHTRQDILEAVERIRRLGFELGLQIMVGLYGDSVEICSETASLLLDLCPDTIRIYPTVILKGTHLEQLFCCGNYLPMSLEEAIEVCSEMLLQFHRKGIRVIKCGLHASREVEAEMVGGIYHPAFKELCENRIYFHLAENLLRQSQLPSKVVLLVGKGMLSKMLGQKRRNLISLQQQFQRDISVRESEQMGLYEVKIAALDLF